VTGREGEEIAVEYLIGKGYRILVRNYRTVLGEIDIIAREGNTLVFIEVKARSGEQFGAPQDAVDPKKQVKVSRVALAYLKHKKVVSCACRFDVVAVLKSTGKVKVTLIQNAFELLETTARC